MSRCSGCGKEESPIWRNRQYQLYQQFTHIDDIRIWEPWLAEILLKLGPKEGFGSPSWTDGYWNYLFKEDNMVVRIPRKCAIHPDSMREPPREKADHRKKDRSQLQLTSFGGVDP